MNPYVFFVGCTRSGTTLLRRIGDAHPELAVAPEQQWLPRYWEWRVTLTPDGLVTRNLLDMLLADRRFMALGLPFDRVVDLVEDHPQKHYARFVGELFDLYGEVQGKRLVGEKTPKYVRYVRTLHQLWPDARFVHLVRDGRDVALSLLDWSKSDRNVGRFPSWSDDPVMTAALYWEWNVRVGQEAGELLGPEGYLESRYETLVADPERECRSICAFLDVPYEPAMLEFHEGRTRDKPGLSAKKAWRPVTPGLRSWREEMSADDVARFEAVAGDLLEELGYERADVGPSGDELERAQTHRASFAAYARACGWSVARAWERVAA